MALTKIKTSGIADNAITNAKMADDAIDSADFANASIDNIHVATGLDAVKLADGTVTNAEFQYINTLSSNAQTQISAKAPIASPTFTGNFTSVGIDDNADATAITIDSSENVGIGTASPTVISNYTSVCANDSSGSMFELMVGGTRTANIQSSSSETHIQTRTATPLIFDTNSSEAMRILSGGNVGIGTTAPSSELQVNGSNPSLTVTHGSTVTSKFQAHSSGDVRIGATSAHPLVLMSGNATALTLDTSQNATFAGEVYVGGATGLGTAKLQVVGTQTTSLGDPQSVIYGGIVSGAYSTLGFGHIEALYPESPIEIGSKCVNTGAGGYSDFFIATRSGTSGAPTTRLTIGSDGNATFAGDVISNATIELTKSTPSYLNLHNNNNGADYDGVSYGGITWEGDDASGSADGVRAKIEAIGEGGAGRCGMKFYTIDNSTTTLTEALHLGFNANATFNGERAQFGESSYKYHILNGSKTGVASGTWTSMAWVNHSHCVQVYVFAYSSGSVTRSAIFDVQTHYGSNQINTRRGHAGLGKISAIELQYNNNGYKLDFRVTTDDASTTTVYWSVVGMSSGQMYNL